MPILSAKIRDISPAHSAAQRHHECALEAAPAAMAQLATFSTEPARIIEGQNFKLKIAFAESVSPPHLTAYTWPVFSDNLTCSGWGQSGLSFSIVSFSGRTATIDCTARANRASPGRPVVLDFGNQEVVTFNCCISSAAGSGDTAGSVTIIDAADAPKVTLTLGIPTIPENGGGSTVTASIPTAVSVPVSITVSVPADAGLAGHRRHHLDHQRRRDLQYHRVSHRGISQGSGGGDAGRLRRPCPAAHRWGAAALACACKPV